MIYPKLSARVATNRFVFGLLMTAPLIFQVITDAIFIQSYCLFMAPPLFVLASSKTVGHPSPLFCCNSLFSPPLAQPRLLP